MVNRVMISLNKALTPDLCSNNDPFGTMPNQEYKSGFTSLIPAFIVAWTGQNLHHIDPKSAARKEPMRHSAKQ